MQLKLNSFYKVLVSFFLFLSGCQSTSKPASDVFRSPSFEKLFQNNRNLGLVLMRMGRPLKDIPEKMIANQDFSDLQSEELSHLTETSLKRIDVILNFDISNDDKNILYLYGLLSYTYSLLERGYFNEAQFASEFLLRQPEQNIEFYTSALIAEFISLVQQPKKPKNTLPNEKNLFSSIEHQLCQNLCDTIGWKTVAQDNDANLSEAWFLAKSITKNKFKNTGKIVPDWFLEDFLSAKTTQPQFENSENEFPLEAMQFYIKNSKFGTALKIAKKIEPSNLSECDASYIYAQNILAQSRRRAQDRIGFLKYQEKFYANLSNSKCIADHFLMTDEEFENFNANAVIWLARLYWEAGKTDSAFDAALKGLKFSEERELWDYSLEAMQVLVGRVGFETLSPERNIKLLKSVDPFIEKHNLTEFRIWSEFKKGLFYFLDGRFSSAIKVFESIASSTEDTNLKAGVSYWLGRSYLAISQEDKGKKALQETGKIDPLGIYDIFAGQFLNFPSGRTSSQETSPFRNGWKIERDKWISLDSTEPFALFEPVQWLKKKLGIADAAVLVLSEDEKNFSHTLRANVVLVSTLRALFPTEQFEKFSDFLRDADTVVPRLIHDESLWLKSTYQKKFSQGDVFVQNRDQIAWLLYVTGDYVNSILFVGSLRGKLDFNFTPSSFLYFIFYPRPYLSAYEKASKTCQIDIDLLYAISRQESLFQKDIISGAGAIGLMQLLPSTAQKILKPFSEYRSQDIDLKDVESNTLAGACYLKELINRYNGNYTFAIAAYNAGEGMVDDWIKNRLKIKDMPYFSEFIPYAETQKYVQRVLRNYYNIKWIYGR